MHKGTTKLLLNFMSFALPLRLCVKLPNHQEPEARKTKKLHLSRLAIQNVIYSLHCFSQQIANPFIHFARSLQACIRGR